MMQRGLQSLSRRAIPSALHTSRRTGISSSLHLTRSLWSQSSSNFASSRRKSTWTPFLFALAGGATLTGILSQRESVKLDAGSDIQAKRSQKSRPTSPSSVSTEEISTPPIPPLEQTETKLMEMEPEASSAETPSDTSEGEENEASSGGGGAYNPETGEINWDCPCLGGMAHGPCGQEFRAAFSCFVYSEDEPKGINCVELFKAMQDCFREHPEVYGEEIMNDDDDDVQNTPSLETNDKTIPTSQPSENTAS